MKMTRYGSDARSASISFEAQEFETGNSERGKMTGGRTEAWSSITCG